MHTFCDDRGRSFMSIFDHLPEFEGQFNSSLMYSGAVKAWHRHALQDDHWVVLKGSLKIGLFNTEETGMAPRLTLAGMDTVELPEIHQNSGRAVFLGEHRPGTLHIPSGLWHGGVAVGGKDALLLYYVTRKYDPSSPDEERASWDAFPEFDWGTEFK